MSAVVIIPTTGSPEVHDAIESVLKQNYVTKCYLICDGNEHKGKVKTIADEYMGNPNFQVCYLPENVGANGFYGHRIYAAFSHLVNEDFVFFLDQDNWFDGNHVQDCTSKCADENLQWAFSLRKIVDKFGNYLCDDNCESLGKYPTWVSNQSFHIDTNSYCIRREVLVRLASAWHGGWGQDRFFFEMLKQNFSNYSGTGNHTVNYRLNGNPGSVTKEFFEQGNAVFEKQYNGKFPWK